MKKPTLKQLYQDEIKRIDNYISKKRKQGYIVPDNIVPTVPKRVTQNLLSSVKSLTPEVIRKRIKKPDEIEAPKKKPPQDFTQRKGRILKVEEETTPRKRTLTAEQKKHLSELGRQRWKKLSEEEKGKIIQRLSQTRGKRKGTKQTEETKKNISEAQREIQKIRTAEIIITNFVNYIMGYENSTLEGSYLIYERLKKMIDEYGEVRVAEALTRAQQSGLEMSYQISAYTRLALRYMRELTRYIIGDIEGEANKQEFSRWFDEQDLNELETVEEEDKIYLYGDRPLKFNR